MSRTQREHRLSHWCGKLIERVVEEPMWATAVDHSGRAIGGSPQAQMAWRAHQKWQGVTPAHLDWYVYQRDSGIYAQIELKIGSNKPDSGQLTTMRLLQERGIPTGCAWSVLDFYGLLKDAGFRLAPESDSIASEIEAKYQAAVYAKPRKSRAAKPRTGKPSMSQLRQIEALPMGELFDL